LDRDVEIRQALREPRGIGMKPSLDMSLTPPFQLRESAADDRAGD
jgi:hypothetical protein